MASTGSTSSSSSPASRSPRSIANFNTRRPDRTWRGRPGEGPRPEGEAVDGGGVRVDFALEDQADVLVRLAGGASGSATVMALSPGNPNHIALSIDGESGGFDWLQEQPNSFVERRPGLKMIRDRDPERLDPADRWTAACRPAIPRAIPTPSATSSPSRGAACAAKPPISRPSAPACAASPSSRRPSPARAERRPVAVDIPGADFARDYPMA